MVRYKFVHFNKRSDFDSYVPNPESNSANGNEYYNYVVFIKDTKEIYTHGQFYNCSDSGDSSIDEILEELKSSINSKADLSSLEELIKEVEENEEVTVVALTELHENKADKSEIPDVSNLVTKNEFNILSAEVEEKVDSTIFTTLSETVAGHTTNINNLSENKADKTDLENYAKKDDLNTKQDQLVSGTTIKTVNGNSILGSGNIETPDTKVTSADNHYGYDANNATSTTGAFVTKITKDAANHVTSFESRALISTDIPELDASKITTGEISIDRLPKGALERLFLVESEAAAISATVQEGDVVQVTGNNNKMYFCISNTATTFATKFKEFTAGTATSVPWSGVTGKPTGIDGWGDRIGVIESGYATQSWVGDNYLSKSGGEVSGSLDINTPEDPTMRYFRMWYYGAGRKNRGMLRVNENNFELSYYCPTDYVNFELTVGRDGFKYNTKDILHSGNYADYALPITGGTVNGSITATSFTGVINSVAPTALHLAMSYTAGQYSRSASEEDGKIFIGSSVNNKVISSPNYDGTNTTQNIQSLRLAYNSSFFTEIATTPNSNHLWKRNVEVGGANPWERFVTEKAGVTWNISITGNADTATKLQTPRTIWGQSFDGTQDITGSFTTHDNLICDAPAQYEGKWERGFKFVGKTLSCGLNAYGVADSVEYLNISAHGEYDDILGIRVYHNGNIAIGGATAGEKLHVYGNVKSSGNMYAVDFVTTSDNRLKDFVSDIYVDFESIKQIPKKYYYWKDKSMGEDLQLGTSAQELAKIYPECVHYDETNDRYSVNYQKLSIVALAAIDKLHDRVSELESKLYDKNN